ncbi:MAG: mobilization relaxase, partial [Rhodobacterales bacterium]|nr:mobilization relaxase [Rhodobacterales bacterium]
MLIKFMGGRGGGGAIAAYLVDAGRAGREEAVPEVVRGDIVQTRELIDSIDRKWTYTTGVISFAIEDAPSEAQQQAVMDDFERLA